MSTRLLAVLLVQVTSWPRRSIISGCSSSSLGLDGFFNGGGGGSASLPCDRDELRKCLAVRDIADGIPPASWPPHVVQELAKCEKTFDACGQTRRRQRLRTTTTTTTEEIDDDDKAAEFEDDDDDDDESEDKMTSTTTVRGARRPRDVRRRSRDDLTESDVTI